MNEKLSKFTKLVSRKFLAIVKQPMDVVLKANNTALVLFL